MKNLSNGFGAVEGVKFCFHSLEGGPSHEEDNVKSSESKEVAKESFDVFANRIKREFSEACAELMNNPSDELKENGIKLKLKVVGGEEKILITKNDVDKAVIYMKRLSNVTVSANTNREDLVFSFMRDGNMGSMGIPVGVKKENESLFRVLGTNNDAEAEKWTKGSAEIKRYSGMLVKMKGFLENYESAKKKDKPRAKLILDRYISNLDNEIGKLSQEQLNDYNKVKDDYDVLLGKKSANDLIATTDAWNK